MKQNPFFNVFLVVVLLTFGMLTIIASGGGGGGGNDDPGGGSLLNPPENLAAVAGDGQVTLSWDSVADADSYNIY